jgi:hypothetical protein
LVNPRGRTVGGAELCVLPDDDAIAEIDMKNGMNEIVTDYSRIDKAHYEMDKDTAEWLSQKDEEVVMKASKSKMDREIGMQMKKIDVAKNDEMRLVQMRIMEYKSLIKQNERKLDDIKRNADARKSVLRRKRVHLKAHPL